MSRDRFDLHTHTTASDGSLRPREMIALSVERGLAGIAVTDHDTVAGIPEALAMASVLGVQCIPGIELSCSIDGRTQVHLLGYLIDHERPELVELLATRERERRERVTAIVDRVTALDDRVDLDAVHEIVGDGVPGRAHVARAMVQRGIVATMDDAFTAEWLAPGGRAFVHWDATPLEEGIAAIHAAGGVAVFAHPGARSKHGFAEEAVRIAAGFGLDGVEVDHPSHDGDIVERCAQLAADLGLVQTAGSDDHGYGPDGSRLGCRTVSRRIVDALEVRAAHHRSA